jgi:hypothetical protein
MIGKYILAMSLLLGLAGCQAPDDQAPPRPTATATSAPTPTPTPNPSLTVALLGLDDGPVSENVIPLVMRGHWRRIDQQPSATISCADADPGNVIAIDRDTINDGGTRALLESIDQISRDYMRATFEERRGSRAVRHQRTLNVDDRGDRLTLRGRNDDGEAFIDHYRRCSMREQ